MERATIESLVRQSGGRMTRVRRALIDVLSGRDCILSLADIRTLLRSRRLTPDRSTIFRELEFLRQLNVIRVLTLPEGRYYEYRRDHTHHHLVCRKCHEIEDIDVNFDLDRHNNSIRKQKKFYVTDQRLELYGYCVHCNSSN